MFRSLSRLGAKPYKFQLSLSVLDIELHTPLTKKDKKGKPKQLPLFVKWSRGRHELVTLSVKGDEDGMYDFSFQKPLVMECTMYLKGSKFLSKESKITVKGRHQGEEVRVASLPLDLGPLVSPKDREEVLTLPMGQTLTLRVRVRSAWMNCVVVDPHEISASASGVSDSHASHSSRVGSDSEPDSEAEPEQEEPETAAEPEPEPEPEPVPQPPKPRRKRSETSEESEDSDAPPPDPNRKQVKFSKHPLPSPRTLATQRPSPSPQPPSASPSASPGLSAPNASPSPPSNSPQPKKSALKASSPTVTK